MPQHEGLGAKSAEVQLSEPDRISQEKAAQYDRINSSLAVLGQEVPDTETQEAVRSKIAKESRDKAAQLSDPSTTELNSSRRELGSALKGTVEANLDAAGIPHTELGAILDLSGQPVEQSSIAAREAGGLLNQAVSMAEQATDPANDSEKREGSLIAMESQIDGKPQGTDQERARNKKQYEIVLAGLGLDQQTLDDIPQDAWRQEATANPAEVSRYVSEVPTSLPGVYLRQTFDKAHKGDSTDRRYTVVTASSIPPQEQLAA